MKLSLTDVEYERIAQAATAQSQTVEQYLASLAVTSNRHFESKGSESQSASETYESPQLLFETMHGRAYVGDAVATMATELKSGSVDLVMTSPPYGLLREKAYGNASHERYCDWFRQFVPGFQRILKASGSLVIDIGGAWNKGEPSRSLYHYELLIMLCTEYGFSLAQEFYWWNPAKLPTPAEWVNVRRVRVKDAVNCVWWLSKTPHPKASNRRVLQRYSNSMKDLLKNGYSPRLRPSGHNISSKFGVNNAGAIPPNLLALANTESNSAYQRYCQEHKLPVHPARFPAGIPAFFVRMLTDPGDLVFDPFAGSCVTGEVCEEMDRTWVCCDASQEYVEGARGRFSTEDPSSFVPGGRGAKVASYRIPAPHERLVPEAGSRLVQDGGASRPFTVAKLQLSSRAKTCLQGYGINTLDELGVMTDAELLAIPGLGIKTLSEIRYMLADIQGPER